MWKASYKIVIALSIGSLICAGIATNVIAQSNSPADTIRARQQHLKDLGAAFKAIRDQMRVSVPDATLIRTSAADMKKAADAMANWFPKGSGPEVGIKTAAKPEIWSDPADFSAAQKNLVEVLGKFAQTANSGDIDAVKAQIAGVGQACKRCHDKYRVKED
ncbi:MAG: cytochrome c [Candidatus Obscuribacterales bacterium]|nr:cytochrome c [Steroidobacteraceae bacterium]